MPRDRQRALAEHARDLGDDQGRDRGCEQREQHPRAARERVEGIEHPVEHEDRREPGRESLEEQQEASVEGDGLGAHEQARQQRHEQHERGVGDIGAASEHDLVGERDRNRRSQRRPELDELAGRDRTTEQGKGGPGRARIRQLGAQSDHRTPGEEGEQPRPPLHGFAPCSSGTRCPRPAEPVPASGGTTAQSWSSTSWPAP